jgi:hypothetical protein
VPDCDADIYFSSAIAALSDNLILYSYHCKMTNFILAIVLKPFIALIFFLAAWSISRLLSKVIPDGKAKRILFSPLPGHGKR